MVQATLAMPKERHTLERRLSDPEALHSALASEMAECADEEYEGPDFHEADAVRNAVEKEAGRSVCGRCHWGLQGELACPRCGFLNSQGVLLQNVPVKRGFRACCEPGGYASD